MIFLSFVYIKLNITLHKQKEALGYQFAKSDVKWSYKSSFRFLMLALIGGIVAGALGLGAGIVLIPLMINIGISPIVSSATGMYLVQC
jgi:uncharacterized membrane protein YfcA